MSRQYDLGLFPLNTVLFPGMPLPLHIFEERYQLMISECVEKRQPFGVVLIRSGREAMGPSIPHQIGTSAIITEVTELGDGRLNIVTVGYQRFRILSLSYDKPYLSGLVESLPPVDEETEEAFLQASLLRPQLEQYVELLGELTETRLELGDVPEKPVLLAFLSAILLQVPRADKQSLLVTKTIPEMLARERLFLRREQDLLRAMIGVEFILEGGQHAFSAS